MFDVIGVGASSIDFVYVLPATPVPDSDTAKLRITSRIVSPGGQTATMLCTAAALGATAKYVGTVGDDEHGRTLVSALTSRGVDVSNALVRRAPSPYAVILVDERHGERSVLWDRHPDTALRPDDLRDIDLTSTKVLHVDDVDPEAAVYAAERARAAGVFVTSDIEQVGPMTPRLIEAVDAAVFAEHLPAALMPSSSVGDALRSLRARPDQLLVVTLGARGAILLAGGEIYSADGYRVSVVDTTGAGDVFRGAFVTGLLRGDRPADVLRFANAAAAASCMKLGAIAGIPSKDDVEMVLRTTS